MRYFLSTLLVGFFLAIGTGQTRAQIPQSYYLPGTQGSFYLAPQQTPQTNGQSPFLPRRIGRPYGPLGYNNYYQYRFFVRPYFRPNVFYYDFAGKRMRMGTGYSLPPAQIQK